MARTKTTVMLEVNGLISVHDEGYLGPEAKVTEHIDKARRDAENWRWFVKKGGTEPQPVAIQVTVKEVRITPGDDAG